MFNFQPVGITASGPRTFRCSHCMCKIYQDPIREEPLLEPRVGTVWADLNGTAFVDYYCTGCKQSLENATAANILTEQRACNG
jgi:hypothetical protein